MSHIVVHIVSQSDSQIHLSLELRHLLEFLDLSLLIRNVAVPANSSEKEHHLLILQ